ncbi:UNVERIFIED_CONTAM: ABC transporter permease [Streptococcus canis]|uniref:ABC transporter permease n=1 Tax=Streptococcus canis TaxID=1329 RepID=A0AAE4Q546_STRCB|nr:ABC transporter permease [Streptococcus canis]MDV5976342.1 ABC transporter permease [Streptococcus canis]
MKALFLKRRQDFHKQQSKYLRYVFNDHFVLVLMFLLGFALVQYSQLLRQFPSNHLPVQACLVVLVLLLLNVGSVATYLEEADQHFLLPKEEEVVTHIKQAERSAFILWAGLQTAILAFLYPIFNRLGFSLVTFSLCLLVLVAVKKILLSRKVGRFLREEGLDWEKAVAFENNRKQAILKFYSLFTSVKGISTKVKKRTYLNPLLKLVKEDAKNLWVTLYLKAFFRSSDYLGLFLRLLLLSSLSLLFITNAYLSVGLALVFNYLTLFQLLSLYHHYDYHYMTGLYPENNQGKKANLLAFLRGLSCLILVTNLLLCHSLEKALILVVVMGIVTLLYLPYKLKKIID